MTTRALLTAALAALTAAGCSTQDPEPVPAACIESREAIAAALQAAPRAVTLADGTRLSQCIERARTDAELQTLGIVVTGVADDLALHARDDPRAAARLGYLIGAARDGARRTNGVALELARRLEQTATLDGAPAAIHAALQAGLRAGEATG